MTYLHFQPLICNNPGMIVIRISSSGHNRAEISRRHCYSPISPQVTNNDKTPTVISSALEKHNQDPKQASRHELIQLLPEGKGKDSLEMSIVLLSQLYHRVLLSCCPNGDKPDIIARFLFILLHRLNCH